MLWRTSAFSFSCSSCLFKHTKVEGSSSSQDDIYMFGGKLEAGWGNVTDELWVFNVPSRTWQRRNPVVGQPTQTQIYAVEGHSAHCVLLDGGDAIMLVIFGYSPIYSYVSNVQEYNLSESQLQEPTSWHLMSSTDLQRLKAPNRHSRQLILVAICISTPNERKKKGWQK